MGLGEMEGHRSLALSSNVVIVTDTCSTVDVHCTVAGTPVGLIVGVTVALFLIILIAVAIVVIIFIWRRRRREREQSVIEDPVVDDKINLPANSTRPFPFDKFCEHVDQLAKNSNLEYASEFEVRPFEQPFVLSVQLLLNIKW